MKRVWVCWSTGKDSAWALHELRGRDDLVVTGVLTTITDAFDRVSMHAVRSGILRAQAERLGLPLHEARIPHPCSDAEYETAMAAAIERARADGVTSIAFGDLFLEDIRSYREAMLRDTGISPIFPLWGRDTGTLAREMIEGGLEARVACVDPSRLDPALAGRRFDARWLGELPAGVDPCGENGEFHTCVTAGPFFSRPIDVEPGEIVHRDGFVFADLALASPDAAGAAAPARSG